MTTSFTRTASHSADNFTRWAITFALSIFIGLTTVFGQTGNTNNKLNRKSFIEDILCYQYIDVALIEKLHVKKAHVIDDRFGYHCTLSFDSIGRLVEVSLFDYRHLGWEFSIYHYVKNSRVPEFVINKYIPNPKIDTVKYDSTGHPTCSPVKQTKIKFKGGYETFSFFDNGLLAKSELVEKKEATRLRIYYYEY